MSSRPLWDLPSACIKYFRSDSAAYQANIIDDCNDNNIYYTITADKDVSVMGEILNIPSKD